jgi:hypothetical protein
MIPDETLAAAWSRAAEQVRVDFGSGLLPTRFDVRNALDDAGLAVTPGEVVRECARVGLRLADA